MLRVGIVTLTLLFAGACGGGNSQTGGGGNGGGTGGSGTGGATGIGGSGTGGATGIGGSGVPGGLHDPARTTTWNPGILSDDQMHMPLGPDQVPVRTTVCASPAPGADINAAI